MWMTKAGGGGVKTRVRRKRLTTKLAANSVITGLALYESIPTPSCESKSQSASDDRVLVAPGRAISSPRADLTGTAIIIFN